MEEFAFVNKEVNVKAQRECSFSSVVSLCVLKF